MNHYKSIILPAAVMPVKLHAHGTHSPPNGKPQMGVRRRGARCPSRSWKGMAATGFFRQRLDGCPLTRLEGSWRETGFANPGGDVPCLRPPQVGTPAYANLRNEKRESPSACRGTGSISPSVGRGDKALPTPSGLHLQSGRCCITIGRHSDYRQTIVSHRVR